MNYMKLKQWNIKIEISIKLSNLIRNEILKTK